jgi:hypothetical protein
MKNAFLNISISFLTTMTSVSLISATPLKAAGSGSCQLYAGDDLIADLTNEVDYHSSVNSYYSSCERKLESRYSSALLDFKICSKHSGKPVVGYVLWEGKKYVTSFTKRVWYTPGVTRTYYNPPSPIDGYRGSYKVQESIESCFLR